VNKDGFTEDVRFAYMNHGGLTTEELNVNKMFSEHFKWRAS